MQGDEHTRNRAVVSPAFRRQRMAAYRHEVLEPVCRRVVDRFAGASPVDLRVVLTHRLPMEVITRLLGLPAEDSEALERWSNGCSPTRSTRTARWPPRPSSPRSSSRSCSSAGRIPATTWSARWSAAIPGPHARRRGDPLVPAPAVPRRHPQHHDASATCSSPCSRARAARPRPPRRRREASGRRGGACAGSHRSATSPGGQREGRGSTASSSPPTRRSCTPSPAGRDPAMFAEPDRFDLDRRPRGDAHVLGSVSTSASAPGRHGWKRSASRSTRDRTRHAVELLDVEVARPGAADRSRAGSPSRVRRVVRASARMELPVPEHVRPIRDRFLRVRPGADHPAASRRCTRGGSTAIPVPSSWPSCRGGGEGRGPLGDRAPEGGRRRRHAVPRLRVHQRGHRALGARGLGASAPAPCRTR